MNVQPTSLNYYSPAPQVTATPVMQSSVFDIMHDTHATQEENNSAAVAARTAYYPLTAAAAAAAVAAMPSTCSLEQQRVASLCPSSTTRIGTTAMHPVEETPSITLLDWIVRLNDLGIHHATVSKTYKGSLECFHRALTLLERCCLGNPTTVSSLRVASNHSNGSTDFPSSAPSFDRATSQATDTSFEGAMRTGEGNQHTQFSSQQKTQYDEGMNVFSTVVSIPSEIIMRSQTPDALLNRVSAILLYNIGHVHMLQQHDSAAHDAFLDALVQCTASPSSSTIKCGGASGFASKQQQLSDNQADDWMVPILHNIGYIEFRKGNIEKSIQIFSQALDCCSRTDSDDMTALAATLNCLGVLHFHLPRSDTAKAMTMLTKSLDLYRTQLLLWNNDIGLAYVASTTTSILLSRIATTLNNIGRVHYMDARYHDALACYTEALHMRRALLGDAHLDVAATVYNAGQTYHQAGQLTTALQYYQDFIRIALPLLGPHHRDIAIIWKCMAQVHHERQEYDPAETYYRKALTAARAALGTKQHAEVASILNKLGNLYYERGDYEQAIQMYKNGLAVERAVLDRNHPNITVTLSNIGQICKQRGDLDGALRLYEEALSIQTKSLDNSNPILAVTLSNIGLIHYQCKRYSLALEIHQEALRIRRDAYGDDNLDVASSLNSIGLVLFKIGMNEMALETFTECFRVRRLLLGDAHREVAITLYNISTIYLELGNDDEAMRCYQRTLEVERNTLGPNHIDITLTLQHIGQVHQQRGELADALKYYFQVLNIQRQHYSSENDMNIARTLNVIANIQLQIGNTAEVVRNMSEATRIALRVNGATGPTNENNNSINNTIRLSGFHLYGFSKVHPEAAAAA